MGFAPRKVSSLHLIAEDEMLISELMIPELAQESAMTRRLLEKVPNDKLGWTPGSGLHTIGWNANHLAEIAGWTPGILETSELDIAPVDGPPLVTTESNDIKEIRATFDKNLQLSLESLKGVSDAVMAEPWTMKMGGHTIFTMAKGDCIRKWIFSHTSHHRAILSTYLRLAGVAHGSMFEE
jgi:uncharacterized damage-inducible protein DinB